LFQPKIQNEHLLNIYHNLLGSTQWEMKFPLTHKNVRDNFGHLNREKNIISECN